jgi:methylenetetrahydrofolate reductase (NADPH)
MTQLPRISFEFFPPKTDKGRENLKNTRKQLAELNPEYFSVTFGAGGSTQSYTLDTIKEIQAESRVDAAPHLSCIGSTRENIHQLLTEYQSTGIHRIVSLRGDIPEGMTDTGEFHFANELIGYIRETTGDHFHIEVAAYPEVHPEATSAITDLENFKRKVESGANGAITQYFYNIDAYFYFVDACEKIGVNLPIVPGIMPITNYQQLSSFSSVCGAQIPRWLDKKLQSYGDDLESIRSFGLEFVTDMCQRLLDQGAPGLHFYTLNKSEASIAIYRELNLPAG